MPLRGSRVVAFILLICTLKPIFSWRFLRPESIVIIKNSKLETMAGGVLVTSTDGIIRIEDNPLLDVNCTHVLEMYATARRIRRNRVNCGCELTGPITTTNINSIQDNCDYIFGKFEINGGKSAPSADLLATKFGKATNITGELAVLNTEFTDLSFLSGLMNITSIYDLYAEEFVEQFIRIENNSRLETLGWTKFQGVSMTTVQISSNPKLCYTVAELDGFLHSEFVSAVEGEICKVDYNETSVCRLTNKSTSFNLPSNCRVIIGQLKLDNTTKITDLWKLYNVTSIYGSLEVVNTSLISFSPLWKLQRLCNPSVNGTTLVVRSNLNLRSIYLHNLNHTLSNSPIHIRNNPTLSLSSDDCERINRSAEVLTTGNKQNCRGFIKLSNYCSYLIVLVEIFLEFFGMGIDPTIAQIVALLALFAHLVYAENDETSNVTHEELFEVLSGLEIIAGSLEIVNTGFKNLSFFGSLFGILSARELYSFEEDVWKSLMLSCFVIVCLRGF
ncbi:hypothetical protein RB195_011872 [Necator americanus]|uniref:Receptor L-domain domain-containing protein n=1 Tax=Necator americanus TaxID=51031 RepID=A0ABR1D4K7_NECAM